MQRGKNGDIILLKFLFIRLAVNNGTKTRQTPLKMGYDSASFLSSSSSSAVSGIPGWKDLHTTESRWLEERHQRGD